MRSICLHISSSDFEYFGTFSLQDYAGHVFWDQETWMYPPVLMLHSDMGKVIIDSRIRTLDAAKKNAAYWGYKGARFPWESAYTGKQILMPLNMIFQLLGLFHSEDFVF